MWGSHVRKKGRWWHYYRAVPRAFSDVDRRGHVSFSLKTGDEVEARRQAARISAELEAEWREAKARGVSLKSQDAAERYRAGVAVQQRLGLEPKGALDLSDAEFLNRLRVLILGETPQVEQVAVLGLTPQPELSLSGAFDRFWDYIKDEWSRVSHDQQRVKRNVYLKSIRNFEAAVSALPFHQVERSHAVQFRRWWVDRVEAEGLKPYTANREINSLRRMFTVNLDIDGLSSPNPFSGVRLKDSSNVSRIPLERAQIGSLLKPLVLDPLAADFLLLFRLLVNTGMRPVEAIGLELADIDLEHAVPHVHVRRNGIRGLKTDHSERLVPLVGVSLNAGHELVARGGWGKQAGKNMYATSVLNKALRGTGIVTDPRQSLYSLRHWFQDQLTKADVIDRAQAQLMGHKFQRPKYGYGKDLEELRAIIEPFAIEGP